MASRPSMMHRSRTVVLTLLAGPLIAGCRPRSVGAALLSAPAAVDANGVRVVRVTNERLEVWDVGEDGFTRTSDRPSAASQSTCARDSSAEMRLIVFGPNRPTRTSTYTADRSRK